MCGKSAHILYRSFCSAKNGWLMEWMRRGMAESAEDINAMLL